MTLREYLIHLFYWFRTFPHWHIDEHTFTGRVNSGVYHCLVCEREEIEEYESIDEKVEEAFLEQMATDIHAVQFMEQHDD